MANGPQHGIIGDEYGTDIPTSQVDDKQLKEEQQVAQYAKSPEFQRIVEHMEARITEYQSNLPGGEGVANMEELGRRWMVATAVIAELRSVINFYKTVEEKVAQSQTDTES